MLSYRACHEFICLHKLHDTLLGNENMAKVCMKIAAYQRFFLASARNCSCIWPV